MKRILVVAVLLITAFSFSGCYPSGVVVRSGPRYYSSGPRYYGGYRHYYYGYNRW